MAIALRKQRVVFAALLRADLEGLAGLLHRIADAEALFDGERERLFAVNVAPRLQAGNRNRHMPVVGGADSHHIGLFDFEHLAVVAVGAELVIEVGVEFMGAEVVHFADGNHVGKLRCLAGDIAPLVVASATAADPDGRELGSAHGVLAKELSPGEGGHGQSGSAESYGLLQEIATRGMRHEEDPSAMGVNQSEPALRKPPESELGGDSRSRRPAV